MTKLSIIMPAYNEEGAIADTIRKCLNAKKRIIADTPVKDVEIIVVSDGSTDRTVNVARGFEPEIKLIVCPENKGYGAAITTGFQNAQGDILSFMDADGTIDPNDLAAMIVELDDRKADICVGSRMGPNSKMPLTRAFGNLLFRWLVSLISNRRAGDVASGVRVLRRECAQRLYPLPADLSFTPAMTCRALLDPNLRLVETPIAYGDRVGRSKLRILHDGARFLRSILDVGISFRPLKLFAVPGSLFLAAALVYGIPLVYRYFLFQSIPEDMIYRILFIIVAVNCAVIQFCLGAQLEHISMAFYPRSRMGRVSRLIDALFCPKPLAAAAGLCYAVALSAIIRPLFQYATTGKIFYHWSWIALSGMFAVMGTIMLTFSLVEYAVRSMRKITAGAVR